MAWGSASSRPDVTAGLCGVARPPGCPAGFHSAPSRRAKGGGGGGLVHNQRQSASQREKMRMRHLAQALRTLRRYLPASVAPAGHSLTKIETLRLAIRYIGHLSELLGLSDSALGRRHCRRGPPWAPGGGWADGPAGDAAASPDLPWEPWAAAEEAAYSAQPSPQGGQTPVAGPGGGFLPGGAPAAAEPWGAPAAPLPMQRPPEPFGTHRLSAPTLPSPGTGAAPFLDAEQAAAAAATWDRLACAWEEADPASQFLPTQHPLGFLYQGQL